MARLQIGMELIGADEIAEAFRNVALGVRNRVLGMAVKKAARIIIPPLRRATPVAQATATKMKFPPGTTRKSVGSVFRKYNGGLTQAVYIGHRFPQGAAAGWRERGTKDRITKGPFGHATGRVPAQPFFGPVWEANKGQVMATLRSTIADNLDEEIRKAAVRSAKRHGLDLTGL